MSSNSNTEQYFAKRVLALKDVGGGHTHYTSQLEKLDNSLKNNNCIDMFIYW